MDLVTWNVNSLRMRLQRVQDWLTRHQPDVVCLQETKVPDDQFPRAELEAVGYRSAFTGEKGLNGVAILSRHPLEDVVTHLPGRDDDTQRRFISARVQGVRVIGVYVPNGQQAMSDAYFFKLDWLSRLLAHLNQAHDAAAPLALMGDFNITPSDLDVSDPKAWAGRLHCTKHERDALKRLEAWGLIDTLRRLEPETAGLYSWFDYRDTFRGFKPDEGLRIDLVYATAPLAERVQAVKIDLEERAGEQPSDHAPVVATFGD